MLERLLKIAYKYNFTLLYKIIIDYDVNILNNTIDIFYDACNIGDIENAQYIYTKINNFYIIDFENIFISVCNNKQFKIALWLLSINETINTITNNEKLLELACYSSSFDIAESLLLNNPIIDLSFDDDIIFKNACIYGNMILIKWLIKMKPNINIMSVHNYTCINNSPVFNMSIKNWISLHNNKYNIIIVNNVFKCKLKLLFKFNYIKNVEDIDTCIICMDRICNMVTSCNHKFCMECFMNFYNKNIDFFCPICRNTENLNIIKIIYYE